MRAIIVVISLIFPVCAFATDWVVRDTDTLIGKTGLTERLVGQSITFFDNSVSQFNSSGEYAYTYGGGGTAMGRYVIGADSTVCVEFNNGFSRCDLFVQSADMLVLITEDGDRFPVRP